MNKEIHIIAYAAGILDGEGCIEIYKATTGKASVSPSYILRVSIAQKDRKMIDWLKENFGGNAYCELKHYYKRNRSFYINRWDLRTKVAAEFLTLVLPYLTTKKEQAKVAIEFATVKASQKKGGRRILSQEQIDWRQSMKDKLHSLKKEYQPYNKGTASTTKRENAQ